jgi:hypothetical protein
MIVSVIAVSAVLLGDGDEHRGRYLALLRVAPAQQRLDSDNRKAAQRDDRLVLEAQLVPLHRSA